MRRGGHCHFSDASLEDPLCRVRLCSPKAKRAQAQTGSVRALGSATLLSAAGQAATRRCWNGVLPREELWGLQRKRSILLVLSKQANKKLVLSCLILRQFRLNTPGSNQNRFTMQ